MKKKSSSIIMLPKNHRRWKKNKVSTSTLPFVTNCTKLQQLQWESLCFLQILLFLVVVVVHNNDVDAFVAQQSGRISNNANRLGEKNHPTTVVIHSTKALFRRQQQQQQQRLLLLLHHKRQHGSYIRRGFSDSEAVNDGCSNNDESEPTNGRILSCDKSALLSSPSLPYIQFIDPQTQCNVVLLGCFHGTTSSAQDVIDVVTVENTDIVVLELCIQRYTDLQGVIQKQQQQRREEVSTTEGEEAGITLLVDYTNPINGKTASIVHGNQQKHKRTLRWLQSYIQMVSKTIQTQGIATGLAASLLGGVSGLQSAVSGFTPGLEFTTAIGLLDVHNDDDESSYYNFDIVLADQDVDETLRKLGTLPTVAGNIFFGSYMGDDGIQAPWSALRAIDECQLHLATGYRAIFGDRQFPPKMKEQTMLPIEEGPPIQLQQLPQVQLFSVLLRNEGAIQDLVRLIVPATGLIYAISRLVAVALGADEIDAENYHMTFSSVTMTDTISTTAGTGTFSMAAGELLRDMLPHLVASAIVFSTGFLALVPVVKVILTERDEALANGIQSACRRAGKGGRVVAILGLLHVNGVARRMLVVEDDKRKK
jgi:pheromone shutdown protein TraB